MGHIIAVSNQKGGVGKTTTCVNLAACLGQAGRRTLVVDLDPQANATSALGIDPHQLASTIYQALIGRAPILPLDLTPTGIDNVSLLPSSMDLAAAEIDLLGVENREHQLRRILEPLSPSFDYILIDSPPSLNILSVNALSAARWVLIPVQAEFMALEGLAHVINIVQRIHAGFNPSLELLGLAVTLYDRRTRLAAEVVRELETIFDGKVFASRITRSVRLSEAPSHGKPIIYYDPKSPGARAYQELSEEIQHACEKTGLGPGA